MSHAHNLDQEFWRPPVQQTVQVQEVRPETETCPSCNTEFVLGARFCYVCGAKREAEPALRTPALVQFLDIRLISNALGLSIASLIAFFIGIVCVIAAFVTGLIYTANTVLDWQAVQIWRIEWLLAATAAFVSGILLKRSADS